MFDLCDAFDLLARKQWNVQWLKHGKNLISSIWSFPPFYIGETKAPALLLFKCHQKDRIIGDMVSRQNMVAFCKLRSCGLVRKWGSFFVCQQISAFLDQTSKVIEPLMTYAMLYNSPHRRVRKTNGWSWVRKKPDAAQMRVFLRNQLHHVASVS